MDKYIKEYLLQYGTIHVKGFGVFEIVYQSAQIHPVLHTFTVPGNYVVFTENPLIDTNELALFMASKKRISVDKANHRILEWINNIKITIASKKEYPLSSIGKFCLNAMGKIEFIPLLDMDISPNSFGLEEFTMPLLPDKKQKQETITEAQTEIKELPVSEKNSETQDTVKQKESPEAIIDPKRGNADKAKIEEPKGNSQTQDTANKKESPEEIIDPKRGNADKTKIEEPKVNSQTQDTANKKELSEETIDPKRGNADKTKIEEPKGNSQTQETANKKESPEETIDPKRGNAEKAKIEEPKGNTQTQATANKKELPEEIIEDKNKNTEKSETEETVEDSLNEPIHGFGHRNSKRRKPGRTLLLVVLFLLLCTVLGLGIVYFMYPKIVETYAEQLHLITCKPKINIETEPIPANEEIKTPESKDENTENTKNILDSTGLTKENTTLSQNETTTVLPQTITHTENYYIILGSFQSRRNAQTFLKEKQKEYNNVVDLGKGQNSELYLIGIGPYTKTDAEKQIQNNIKGWILKK